MNHAIQQPDFWPLLAQAVGRLHVALVHFPVALLIVAAALEAWALVRSRGRGELSRAAGACVALGAVAAVFAAATGWLLAGLPAGHTDVEWHRWLGSATAAGALVAWAVRPRAEGQPLRPARARAHLAVLAAVASSTVVAGHMGGSLTHGSGYLTELWPRLLRRPPSHQPAPTPTARARSGPQTPFERAWAVLEERCVECHGPDKRKGWLRLDSRPAALAGGKHGPAIVPGDAQGSYLVARIYGRPPDDPMPPDDPLTDEQVRAIEAWIDDGAPWPQTPG